MASFFRFFFVRPQTTHGMYHFLCTVYFYQKYLVLNFERILSFEHKIQNHCRAEGPPFQFFGTMRLSPSPFRLCENFSNFNASKRSPFTFLMICNKVDFQKTQRVPALTIFPAATLDVPILFLFAD